MKLVRTAGQKKTKKDCKSSQRRQTRLGGQLT
jgi:hypothetical protein